MKNLNLTKIYRTYHLCGNFSENSYQTSKMSSPRFSKTSSEAIKIAKLIVKQASLKKLTDDDYEKIKKLLPKANINAPIQHFNNDTLMHLAVRMNLCKLLEMLINLNGDLTIKNNDNETTVDLALKLNRTEIVELINSKTQQINNGAVSIDNLDSQDYYAELKHELKINKDKCKFLKIIKVKDIKNFQYNFCELFPNLFALKIECSGNDESETLNFLSRQFYDKRPLFVHFTNTSSYYFRKENTIGFVDENSAEFNTICQLIHNQEQKIDIQKEIIIKNDTFAMRFLKIFKLTNQHRLVIDSIKFGSLEMVQASLYLPFYGNQENFVPNIAKLMSSVFGNDESILRTAIENEKFKICDFLIKIFKSLFPLLPFKHRKKIVDVAFEKNLQEILIKLLKTDFPFPDFKETDITQEIKNLINEREKFKFDNIDYIQELIDILRNDENYFLRYAYDKTNKSALYCALKDKKLKTYSFLRSQGFQFDNDEYSEIRELLDKLTDDQKHNLKVENAYDSYDDGNNYLRLLINKFALYGFYETQKELNEKFEFISNCLNDLNQIDEIRSILKICAQIEKIKIIIDLNNELIFDIDPLAIDCCGSATGDGLIFVAAKTAEQKIKETIIHECCHFVINEYYENDFKPYFSFDNVNEENFKAIVEQVKGMVNNVDDDCNNIIGSVFDEYEESEHSAELIVRVLSLLAFYGNENIDKINQLRIRYKNLFDYSKEFITDKINIKEILKRSQVRRLNRYLGLIQDIDPKVTHLKLSKHKKRALKLKNIIKNPKNFLIVSNIPLLTLIELQTYLHNLQSSLYDAQNIFIDPKSLQNEQKYDDFKNIIQDDDSVLNLKLIVDFSHDKNIRAIQKEIKSIYVTFSNQQEVQEFLNNNKVEYETETVDYKWNDLTQICQENLLKEQFIKFQGNKIALKELVDTKLINEKSLNEILKDLCYENSISINSLELFSEEYFVERNFLITPKNIELKIPPKSIQQEHVIEQSFNKALNSREIKIQVKNNLEYDMNQVLELTNNEKFVLISDIGGSGKSRILKKIFNIFYDDTEKWIVFINLREYLAEFNEWDNKMSFLDFHDKFLSRNLKQYEIAIFHDFYNQGKVKILMDGFDEISPKCKDTVIEAIKSILKSESQLWLTTRVHLENELNQFNPQMIFSLKKVEIEKQKEFLVKYWTFKNIKNGNLEEKANDLVMKLANFMHKFRLVNVIGIMQQLRILADICIKNGELNTKFMENFIMYDIYKQSLADYIKLWKASPLGEEEDTELLCGINKCPNFHTVHQYYALLEHFPESMIRNFFKNEGEMWKFESVARGGIITYGKSTRKPIFIHATYVDFFVANFILQTLCSKPDSENFHYFSQIFIEVFCKILKPVIAMFINDKISTTNISEAVIGRLAEILSRNFEPYYFQSCIFNHYENNFDFLVKIIKKIDSEKRKEIFKFSLYYCLHPATINKSILEKVIDLYTEFYNYDEIIELLSNTCIDLTLFQKSSVDHSVVQKIMTAIIKWSQGNKENVKRILFGGTIASHFLPLHSVIISATEADFNKFEYLWKLHEQYLTSEEMEKYFYIRILLFVARGTSRNIFKFIYEKIKKKSTLNFANMLNEFLFEFALNNRLAIHETLWECIELESKENKLNIEQLMLKKLDNARNYLHILVNHNQTQEILSFTISKIVENVKNYFKILTSKNIQQMNLLHQSLMQNKNLEYIVTLMNNLKKYLGDKKLKNLFFEKNDFGVNFLTFSLNTVNDLTISEILKIKDELKFSVDEFKYLLSDKDEKGNFKNFLFLPTQLNIDYNVHNSLWAIVEDHFKDDIKRFIKELNEENYNILQISVAYNSPEVTEIIWSKVEKYLENKKTRRKYLLKHNVKGKSLYDVARQNTTFNTLDWVKKIFEKYNIIVQTFQINI